MKKIISLILCVCMLAGMATAVFAAKTAEYVDSFSDSASLADWSHGSGGAESIEDGVLRIDYTWDQVKDKSYQIRTNYKATTWNPGKKYVVRFRAKASQTELLMAFCGSGAVFVGNAATYVSGLGKTGTLDINNTYPQINFSGKSSISTEWRYYEWVLDVDTIAGSAETGVSSSFTFCFNGRNATKDAEDNIVPKNVTMWIDDFSITEYDADYESIAFSAAEYEVEQGKTTQLTVTGTKADSTTEAVASGVKFESYNTDVATVSEAGVVTTVKPGTADIYALYEGCYAKTTITVTEPPKVEVWQIDFENQDYTEIFNSSQSQSTPRWTDDGLVIYNKSSQGRFNSKSITWKKGYRYVIEYTWKAAEVAHSNYGIYFNVDTSTYFGTVTQNTRSVTSSLRLDEWTSDVYIIDNIEADQNASFFLLDWNENKGHDAYIIKDFRITAVPPSQRVYDELDLSRTDAVMSTSDIPVKLKVDGYKDGVLVKKDAEDDFITFESSNPEIASVDANGNVTAHKNGIATITAEIDYLSVSKSIMFIVGPSTENDCETASTNTSSKVSFSDFGRNDSHSWKYSGDGEAKIVSTMNVKEHVPVVSCWFYDDGTAGRKGVIRATGKTDGSNPYLNIWFGVDESNYTGTNGNGLSKDNLIRNSIPRSKGWHQVVFTSDNEILSVYVDGSLVMQGSITATHKYFGDLTWYENSAPSGSALYYDDIAFSDIYAKAAPVVSASAEVKNGGAIVDKENPENVLFANSYIVYATITNYENIVNYGMTLKRIADGKTLDLTSQYDDSVVVEKLGGADGQFSFKVYGKAIDESACTLTPYIKTEDGVINGNESAQFGGQ